MSDERKFSDDHVAQTIYDAMRSDDDETWEELDDDAKGNILNLALIAGRAHDELLQDMGFRIAPPGTMLRPKSDNDARAMIKAGQDFLAQPEHARLRRKTLLTKPTLILPRGTLQ